MRVPQRGDKRELAETVRRNAEHALVAAPHPPRRRPDDPQPGAAGDPGGPRPADARRCGSSATTSRTTRAPTSRRRWSCSRTGSPARASTGCSPSAARRAQGARDDTAAMHEVITRRFRRYLADRADVAATSSSAAARTRTACRCGRARSTRSRASRRGSRTRRTSSSSTAARRRSPPRPRRSPSSASTTSRSCGLAKRLEEVWLPGEDYPVILQRSSEGLYLLQRVRDEAHRFAITAHRKRRSKGMTVSVLDDVPGLGPARQAALLRALRLGQAAAGGVGRGDRVGAGHGRRGPRGRRGALGRRSAAPRDRAACGPRRCPSRLACWTHERRAFADHGARRASPRSRRPPRRPDLSQPAGPRSSPACPVRAAPARPRSSRTSTGTSSTTCPRRCSRTSSGCSPAGRRAAGAAPRRRRRRARP